MRRLVRTFAAAAIGFAAASLYRQWQEADRSGAKRRRHHLETWENEGGALPIPATATGERSDRPVP